MAETSCVTEAGAVYTASISGIDVPFITRFVPGDELCMALSEASGARGWGLSAVENRPNGRRLEPNSYHSADLEGECTDYILVPFEYIGEGRHGR